MKRYIKERNKLYDDLTKQENDLQTTPTFLSPPIEKTEEEPKEEIANKIVRDRFLQYQDRVNYSEMEKNIILQNKKIYRISTNTKATHILLYVLQLYIFFHICSLLKMIEDHHIQSQFLQKQKIVSILLNIKIMISDGYY
jgi:hypothetical protein